MRPPCHPGTRRESKPSAPCPPRVQAELPARAPALPAGSTEASWAGSRARSSLSVPRRRDAGPQGSAAAAVSARQSGSSDTTPGSRAAGTQAVFRTDSPGCARLRGAIDSQVHTSPLLSNSSESPRFEGTPGGHMPQGEAVLCKGLQLLPVPFPSLASFCRLGLLLCTHCSPCLGALRDRLDGTGEDKSSRGA